jgi:hypothetical protein
MPRLKTDYSKTVIYKIVCNDLEIKDYYVGHTTDFTRRKSCHKCACCNENSRDYNFKVYQMIREYGGWNNWTMIEIEKFPCKDGNEARTQERYWFEQLGATLNMIYPIRSQKEYREENIEHIKEQKKTYYLENIDKIKKYHEENIEHIKERKKKYYLKHSEEYQEYRTKYNAEHREELNKKVAKYRADNRDKINQRRRELKALKKKIV